MTMSARYRSRASLAADTMREVLPSTSPTTRLSCAITQRNCRGSLKAVPYFGRRAARRSLVTFVFAFAFTGFDLTALGLDAFALTAFLAGVVGFLLATLRALDD